MGLTQPKVDPMYCYKYLGIGSFDRRCRKHAHVDTQQMHWKLTKIRTG